MGQWPRQGACNRRSMTRNASGWNPRISPLKAVSSRGTRATRAAETRNAPPAEPRIDARQPSALVRGAARGGLSRGCVRVAGRRGTEGIPSDFHRDDRWPELRRLGGRGPSVARHVLVDDVRGLPARDARAGGAVPPILPARLRDHRGVDALGSPRRSRSTRSRAGTPLPGRPRRGRCGRACVRRRIGHPPTHFLIGPGGDVAFRRVGALDFSGLEDRLQSML